MLTRRGILGALGATVAGGPSMAAGIAQQAIGSGGIGSAALGLSAGLRTSGNNGAVGRSLSGGASYVDSLRQQLAEHLGMSSAEIRAQHEQTLAEIAEADVLALRSVSARHKTQMVIERRISREHARRGNWIMQELMRAEKNP